MNYGDDYDQQQRDRAIERRQHHDEFVKRKPDLLDAEWDAMRATLIEAERKAMDRRFDAAPITGFGGISA